MSVPTVVGLDLSLTSTGVAIIAGPNGRRLLTVTSKPSGPVLADRHHRLWQITEHIISFFPDDDPDLVVIEGPAYSRTTGQQHERAGLWWLVVDRLIAEHGIDVVDVGTGPRAKYATGMGNAGKAAVLTAVARRYPWADLTGPGNQAEDKADALVLAAMGRRWLGHPIEDSLPKTHLAAMDGVHWPEVAS